MQDLTFPVRTCTVRPWVDPVVDAVGHELRSTYVERFWLGILGPTATWLLRRLADRLDEHPEGFELDLAATAAELGVGRHAGKHAPFVRSLQRCIRFGVVEVIGPDAIRVRRKLSPLTRFQLDRLPAHLQEAHQRYVDGDQPQLTADELREHVRGCALSLLAQGYAEEAAEHELHRRAVHPALAHAAVVWATSHRAASVSTTGRPLPPAA